MQYGGSNGSHHHYTPGPASRGGERGRAGLPDIGLLWRANGVTTRPDGSGLRLTVKHVELPGHSGALAMPALPQGRGQTRLSRSEPTGRPLQLNTQRRASLRDTPRLLSRAQQLPGKPGSLLPQASVSSSTAPKASRTMLPPLPANSPGDGARQQLLEEEREEEISTNNSSERGSSSLEESDEEEIYSDDEEGKETGPSSRPGFESETEQSTHIFDIPFPLASGQGCVFPATLQQTHLHLDTERLTTSLLPSGLSPHVNNIVRAFTIRGPVDRDLLSRALDSVASFHPVLSASFQRAGDTLFMHTLPPGPVSVNLESPVVGHEKPEILITNARRKPFVLPLRNDLVAPDNSSDGDKPLSIVSLASSRNSSDDSEGNPPRERPLPSSAKKSVTFGRVTSLQTQPAASRVLSALPAKEPGVVTLMRARLVRESVSETTLILSFPRIICDFWSSCLFVRQLAEAYGQLEGASGTSRRIEARRREVASRFGYQQPKLRERELALPTRERGGGRYRPSVPAQLGFQQVALRERQLLRFVAKERLWAFWDDLLKAVIKRQRGPNRVKVVPPVRIPSGLGEKIPRVPRPQTSRLRPLTGRGRPQTGRRLEAAGYRDSLAGPKTDFHFLKFDEAVCSGVCEGVLGELGEGVREEEVLSLVCLGAFVVLLGRCCRGWGEESGEREGGERERERIGPAAGPVRDPLQQYQSRRCQLPSLPTTIPAGSSPQRSRRAKLGGRLDLGSFLVGVEASLRQSHPRQTMGLFAPLTSDVAIRVNLSSSETFPELVCALGKTLQSVRNHHHFPFSTVTDELGVPAGLPVRFSYLSHSDVAQLCDPDHFYFPETAVGVKGHGLARLGTTCYMSPLCTRLDDSRHLELSLWEDTNGVGGVLLYQPQVLRKELVEGLARELTGLMATIARDPSASLSLLSSSLSPPFTPHSRSRRALHH